MENQINIGSLVLDPAALEVEQPTVAKERKKTEVVYSVEVQSGPDYVIARTAGKSRKLLVLLVSQQQFYIKTESTGKIERLTKESLQKFFASMKAEEPLYVEGGWLDGWYRGRDSKQENIQNLWGVINGFSNDVKGNELCEIAKMNIFSYAVMAQVLYDGRHSEDRKKIIKCKTLVKTIDQPPTTVGEALLAEELLNIFGLDNTRKVINRAIREGHSIDNLSLLPTLLSLPSCRFAHNGAYFGSYYSRHSLIENVKESTQPSIKFDFRKLENYLFDESVAQGQGDSLDGWLQLWIDDLTMQTDLLNRVEEKYPSHLHTHHDVLSYEVRQRKQEIDAAKWAQATEKASYLESACESHCFTVPQTPEDMREEAVMQSNCLASYIGKVLNGETQIVFCRKRKSPDKSLLTIEVNPKTKTLVQVKARFNREATKEDLDVVLSWCVEVGINHGMYKSEATAA